MWERYLEVLKWRILVGTLIGMLISGGFCFNELRYLLFAKRADAKVLAVRPVSARRSNDLEVQYQFTDDAMAGMLAEDRFGKMSEIGLVRTETDLVGALSHLVYTAGQTAPVQYIPGRPESSRLAGNGNLGLCIPFLLCAAVVAALSGKIWLEYNELERRKLES